MRLGPSNLQAREALYRAEQIAIAPYQNLRAVQRGFLGDDGSWEDGLTTGRPEEESESDESGEDTENGEV